MRYLLGWFEAKHELGLENLALGHQIGLLRRQVHKLTCRPSQGWLTFLRNHAGAISPMDFLVVPTVTCGLFYVLVVITHMTSSNCRAWNTRNG